jgi:hypothetical protein
MVINITTELEHKNYLEIKICTCTTYFVYKAKKK